MSPRWRPAAVGAGAGLLLLVLPEGLGAVIVVVVAALVAGWVLPESPMAAAVLFLVPTTVVGAIRVVLEDDASNAGALIVGLVVTVLFVAVFTHVGAGLALRRLRA